LVELLGGEAVSAAEAVGLEGVWVLAAEVDGKPADVVPRSKEPGAWDLGTVAVRVPKLDIRRGFVYVDIVTVLPEQQRRGVGQALLARVEELAREIGLAGGDGWGGRKRGGTAAGCGGGVRRERERLL
jgi:GNAT superfamily N-acetyltransferase